MPKLSNLRTYPHFDAPPPSMTGELRGIAARYNLQAISPREMVDLSAELYESGYLTSDQHTDLSFQPEMMPNFDVTIGALTGKRTEPDRPRNYAEVWRQRLKFEKTHAANAEHIIVRTQKILALLEKIESQPKKSLAFKTIDAFKNASINRDVDIPDRPFEVPLKLPPLKLSVD